MPHLTSSLKKQPAILPTKAAWHAILGLIITTLICLLIGAAKILIILFPVMSLSVGFFLYQRFPTIYISFTLWLWFLTTFVARLIGYKIGSVAPGGNATAPLVTWICFLAFIQNFPNLIKNRDGIGLAYILCFGSLFYSILLRWSYVISSPISEIGIFLGTLAPIILSFNLYANWRDYPSYRSKIQKTFLWMVIVIGGYGIFQFLVAPAWDTISMVLNVGDNTWIGKPEPLGIRVFSTMTSPFTFAINLMPGLILLNVSQSRWKFIAIILGYLSMLLTQYRTAWYSLTIAILILIFPQKSQTQIRLISSLMIIIMISLLLTNVEPFASVIRQRLDTFSNLAEDYSGTHRIEQFQNAFPFALTELIGKGIGNESINYDNTLVEYSGFDMGIIQVLLSLGWIGTIPYISGITLFISKMFWNFPRNDLFAACSRAIVIASLIRIATSSIMTSEFAFPLWLFIGIGMSAHRYHSEKSLGKI
jgi:hypothetical protein